MTPLVYKQNVPDDYMTEVKDLWSILYDKGYLMDMVELYNAWKDFSDDYCASWLIHSMVDEFILWVEVQ